MLLPLFYWNTDNYCINKSKNDYTPVSSPEDTTHSPLLLHNVPCIVKGRFLAEGVELGGHRLFNLIFFQVLAREGSPMAPLIWEQFLSAHYRESSRLDYNKK